MSESVRVKICGVSCTGDVEAAVQSGASYVGFVFYPLSPRSIDIERAQRLSGHVPRQLRRVALTVNASDQDLDQIANAGVADIFQLHGQESAERTKEIRRRYRLEVMKAVGVRGPGDVDKIPRYAEVADRLLVDAKPATEALPGGNGLTFDWRLIQGLEWNLPWMLAGGLHSGNVAAAIRLTGASEVDVSTGVESALGRKDSRRIAEFVSAAKEG